MANKLGRYSSSIFALAALVAPAFSQQLKVFFGNLHSHTSYSDGSGTPDEAYRHARDVAKIDFLAITEHNHKGAPSRIPGEPSLYCGSSIPSCGTNPASVIATAGRFNVDGTFVAIYGQEFSSIGSGNHANVFEVPAVIQSSDVPNGRWDKLLQEWIPNHLDSTGAPALMLLNHPAASDSKQAEEYGRDDPGFTSFEAWRSALDARAELINMVNGPSHQAGDPPGSPSDSEFLRYLNLGFHLAPTADQDNHLPNWGNAADTRTGVIASALTKSAILDALRARHVYASTDKNLRVIARVNGNLMGTQLTGAQVPATGSALTIAIEISDDDEPEANYKIHVFRDTIGGAQVADSVKTVEADGDGTITIPGVSYGGGNQYFFFEIIQTDDDGEKDTVWTAPIWFEPTALAVPAVVQLSMVVDLIGEEAVITNVGSAEANLSQWVLVSMIGNQQRFTLPVNFKLAAGKSVKVTSGPSAQHAPPNTLRWTTNFIWRNAGDPAELRNGAQVMARFP